METNSNADTHASDRRDRSAKFKTNRQRLKTKILKVDLDCGLGFERDFNLQLSNFNWRFWFDGAGGFGYYIA